MSDAPNEQDTPTAEDLEALLSSEGLDPRIAAAFQAERARADEARERMLRSAAEAENQKKRLEREFAERARFANEKVLRELLQVHDSLQLALAHSDKESELAELRKGIEMALEQFKSAMQNVDAEPIEAERGMAFDPRVHEAVLQDDEADLPSQTIAAVMQSGFTYHERILRPARVVVSTGKGLKN